jgi:hypothetical protein
MGTHYYSSLYVVECLDTQNGCTGVIQIATSLHCILGVKGV